MECTDKFWYPIGVEAVDVNKSLPEFKNSYVQDCDRLSSLNGPASVDRKAYTTGKPNLDDKACGGLSTSALTKKSDHFRWKAKLTLWKDYDCFGGRKLSAWPLIESARSATQLMITPPSGSRSLAHEACHGGTGKCTTDLRSMRILRLARRRVFLCTTVTLQMH